MATAAVAFLVGLGLGWLIAIIREPEILSMYDKLGEMEIEIAQLEERIRMQQREIEDA